ncbi:MAG TPA: ATP-binding protein [Myxococcales bacterium]
MVRGGDDYQRLPVAVLCLSREGVVLASNPVARELLGPQAEPGARSDAWLQPGDRERWARVLADSVHGGVSQGHVLRHQGPDGEGRVLQWSVRWCESERHYLAVALDVSAWSAHERYYEQILDCLAEYVLVKGKGSRLRWANRAFREYYGMTNEQLKELVDAPFNEPDYTKQYVLDDLWVWNHQRPMRIECEPVTRHDGVVRKWRTTKSPVLDERGRVAFTVGVSQDITERLEAEERAVNAARLAALGEMAAGIAHEINNPLSVMMARAQLLRLALERGTLSAKQLEEALSAIERSGARVAQIIRGLRRLSHEGSSDPFQVVPLASIFEDTLALCRARFLDDGIALRLPTLPADLRITCRPVQISQVLLNLLANALDAVRADSRAGEPWVEVRVALEDDDDTLAIRVLDSGPGVPEELETRIMQPFFTTKPPGHGTGLGLSISLAIAKEHGGSLKLDRAVSPSCFVLRIKTNPIPESAIRPGVGGDGDRLEGGGSGDRSAGG